MKLVALGFLIAGCAPVPPPALPPRNTAAAPDGHTSMFAVAGACASGGRCVGIYEIDGGRVRLHNELVFSYVTDELIDIAWPQRDTLYAVIRPETGIDYAWGRIPSPLTADDAALTAVRWQPEKLGDVEPEGFRFGIEADGDAAALVACANWIEDNEEEWHCETPQFVSLATKRATRAPLPAFTTPMGKATTIGDVRLRVDEHGLACSVAGQPARPLDEWLAGSAELPMATVPLAGDTYVLVRYSTGARMAPNPSALGIVLKGCAEHPTIQGYVVPGPDGLWLHRKDNTWTVHHALDERPLLGTDGKPFVVEGDVVVWTH